MDLGSFLADESFGGGSWADEEVDLSTIGVAVSSTAAPIGGAPIGGSSFSNNYESLEPRRERKEFPIPDKPPYRARIGNLPWEVEEAAVGRFFEDRMQMENVILDMSLPVDHETGKLKGFAFITFSDREVLEEALQMNMTDFNGRRIFVNVAAPQRSEFDGDWRGSRSGPMGGREEPDIDWSAPRGQALPPRERGDRPDRGDRPERSERPPRAPEPEFNWGSARGQTLPPRERSNRSDRPERTERPKKQEPALDWSRGQPLPARAKYVRPTKKTEEKSDQLKPQKSVFSVLALEGESDDEPEQEQAQTSTQETGLEEATANLSVEESKDVDGWEVVRK